MKPAWQVFGLAALPFLLLGSQSSLADDGANGNDADAASVEGQRSSKADPDLQSAPDPAGQARVETREQSPYGRYLTDADGMSLYLFANDQPGADNSTCDQTCAIAWPPYATQAEPQAGEHVDGDLLDTIEREDGSRQVTYDGWPLYYFSGDKAAGDALGQDVIHLGAAWYLLSPDGERIEAEERAEASR
ncbi:hypothetical protein QLQ86_01815 [Halomonas sp. LR5S13]|uniref:COG4315 family predicted lipoprotein n=1 Tax=Halomonas rhizosphaerae TaxID=3043296 RepID=UPI0024A8B652|nr:hypothetical protein [Halomonas rhizosphaerae]MDI5919529.1 hypothetical protein [Halomonas rhizosphaerae]